MTARRELTRPGDPRPVCADRVKDEVYRQMFLLEESRAGAATALALALLRAWIAADTQPAAEEEREWLRKISPICIEMIETSLQEGGAGGPSPH